MYLYAFLGDADMQTVILILDIGDSGDSNILYFSRVPRRNLIIYVRVRGTREDYRNIVSLLSPSVHE